MAQHLDLEEQEQLDQVKHFWKRYGNLITWGLILVLGAYAAWNGYAYWQRSQAVQAAALYDEVERSSTAGDMARLERAVNDMRDKFGGTLYAQQASLLAAKTFYAKGSVEPAKAALKWVVEKSSDEGYQAIARLRLAGILLDAKAYDDALQQLSVAFPVDFEALADDRRGDVFAAQGKRTEAIAEYGKAYRLLDTRADYRRMIEVKLNALGVDPAAAPAGAEAKK